MTDAYTYVDSKKYMWDEAYYDSEDEAKGVKEGYEADEFDCLLLEEEGKFLVYSRRVVTEIVLEGEP